MLEPEDLLAEEQAHPELLRELQKIYQMKPKERRALARVRERLEDYSPTPLPTPERSQTDNFTQAHKTTFPLPSPSRHKWGRRINLLVALLVVVLLVGSFAFVFSKINQTRTGVNRGNTSAPPKTVSTVVELTEGLRLAMIDAQTGWAVGDDIGTPYGTVLHTTDGGKHWQQVTPSGVHEVGDLLVLDQKTAWVPVWDQSKSIYPVAIYRTIDGGTSWQRFSCPASTVCIPAFADQNNGWLISSPQDSGFNPDPRTPVSKQPTARASKSVLYHTGDGGKTWQTVATFPFSGVLRELHFIDEKTGWVSMPADINQNKDRGAGMTWQLYVTHDGGHTWNAQHLPAPPEEQSQATPSNIAVPTFLNEREGYLLARFSQAYYLYITQDGGKTWQVRGDRLPDVGLKKLLDMQHAVTGAAPGAGGPGFGDVIMLTLKNGKWMKTALSLPGKSPLIDFSFVSANVGVVLIDNPAQRAFDVYKTTDGGKTWQKVGSMLRGS